MRHTSTRPCLLLFATLDPRGNKIGGIETHIRHLLRNFPADCDIVLAGIDEFGDSPLGQPIETRFGKRDITFVPLAHIPAEIAGVSAKKLLGSTTLNFVLGGLRHLLTLRKLVANRPVSADLPRVEFAILPKLLGVPFALTIHSDLSKAGKTDSLLRKYGAVKRWSEALAFRWASKIYGVNADILADIAQHGPEIAAKTALMTVPVDTAMFQQSPLQRGDGPFRVVYAGRFEAVKDPALMFETIGALKSRLAQGLEFHVIGFGDPTPFAEFAPIADLTIRHGGQSAEGVAKIVADAHCGLMTSHSEGMPCFLLETLASGRPFVATRLPTFEALIRKGETGELVARRANNTQTACELADALARVAAGIQDGTYRHDVIAPAAQPYSVAAIFGDLFEAHRVLRTGNAPTLLTGHAPQTA